MYIMSMLSLFRLRKRESTLERPFEAPFYPYFPGVALLMAVISLAAMIYNNRLIFGLFIGLFALAWIFYRLTARWRRQAAGDALLNESRQ